MAMREVGMSKKRYTEEFKIEAVRQVEQRQYLLLGYTIWPYFFGKG